MRINQFDCEMCGKLGAKVIHVARSYGSGVDILVIEDVPVISCPHCGESYLTADTLRAIENIKQNRSTIAFPRSVSVAAFV